MDEFDFINLLKPLAGPQALRLTDDAALLEDYPGKDIVISTDTMVEGVHFPMGRRGGGFSERLLRTSLSDLAAKGARPIGYFLNVAWPRGTDSKWIIGFVKGLSEVQSTYGCPLLGGDTTSTSGPLVASATVLGVVPHGTMVTRAGARAGDDVWFTGVLGLAETGLAVLEGASLDYPPDILLAAEKAYLRPVPRFAFRKALRKYASAAADISDGLVSEAGHIARASDKRLDIDSQFLGGAEFGDDYELLFTAAPSHREALIEAAQPISLKLTRCGSVSEGEGVWVDDNIADPKGYTHKL